MTRPTGWGSPCSSWSQCFTGHLDPPQLTSLARGISHPCRHGPSRHGQPRGCVHHPHPAPHGSQTPPSPFRGRVQFGLKVLRNCCVDSKPNPAKTGMDTFSSPFSLRMTACWCRCRATYHHSRCSSPAASPAATPGQHPQREAEQNSLQTYLFNLSGLHNTDISPAKTRHK